MNKVDLVNNKRKMRSLQNEIEDLAAFDRIFHVSAETGFGIDALVEYLVGQAKPRKWTYHPRLKGKLSEVERVEEAMR